MSKIARIALFILLAAAAASAQEVSFKILGGLTRIQGDDYNRVAAGTMDFLRDTTSVLSGEFGRFGGGYNIQGEIVTHWGRRIAVGLGGGVYEMDHLATVVSSAAGADGSVVTETAMLGKMSVVPFYLNFYYRFRLTPRAELDVFAGPVFGIAQLTSERTATVAAAGTVAAESFRSSQIALGGQAGLGLSFELWRGVHVVADGFYRSAKVSNFTGNWALITTTPSGSTSQASDAYFYWYYDYTQGRTYPRTGFFNSSGPSGEGISGVRKASIDLSGLTFTAGVKLVF